MLNIMVSGCNGKMGKEVVNELNFSKNMLGRLNKKIEENT